MEFTKEMLQKLLSLIIKLLNYARDCFQIIETKTVKAEPVKY